MEDDLGSETTVVEYHYFRITEYDVWIWKDIQECIS